MKTLVKIASIAGCVLLLLISFIASVSLFRMDHLIPLAVLALLSGVTWIIYPKIRKISAGLFISVVFLFLADVFVLHHRIAVWCRTNITLLGSRSLVDVLPSPSGKTLVYVIEDRWLDNFYGVYVSDGGLFPKWQGVPIRPGNFSYRRDVVVGWNGDVFSIQVGGDPLRYSEKDRAFELPIDSPVAE